MMKELEQYAQIVREGLSRDQYLEIKDTLKRIATEIHILKPQRKQSIREKLGVSLRSLEFQIFDKKYEYRHMHIAYCMIRGRVYEQIEQTCDNDHYPNRRKIREYLEQWGNTE